MKRWDSLYFLLLAAGCDGFTDPATRLAADIEAASNRLGGAAGATYTASHETPSKAGDCAGPYTVQFDRFGALIIRCRNAAGATVSRHSTTYHARFVDTQRTFILDKPSGSTLAIDLQRRNGRAVIIDVR
jgi:hypothetical protein